MWVIFQFDMIKNFVNKQEDIILPTQLVAQIDLNCFHSKILYNCNNYGLRRLFVTKLSMRDSM